MAQGGKRRPVPDGGQTMQLDAVVDELEEVAAPPGGYSMPPPLPPKKKTSTGMIVLGVVVVLLMAGLGIGAGMMVLGGPTEPAAPTAPVAEADEPAARPVEEAATAPEELPSDEGGEDTSDVVQLDEVIVGAE